MKPYIRQLAALLIAAAIVGVLGALAHAQSLSFEVGMQSPIVNSPSATPYVMVRDNIPLSGEFLGTKLWLLPELRVQTSPFDLTFRTQFLMDNERFALFVDYWANQLQTLQDAEMFLRFGLRFSLNLGAHP